MAIETAWLGYQRLHEAQIAVVAKEFKGRYLLFAQFNKYRTHMVPRLRISEK